MVHSFFETIASEPHLANVCANNANHCYNPTRSFAQVFSVFFPEDGELDGNVETWLDVIGEGFQFDKVGALINTLILTHRSFDILKFH